MGQGHGNGGDKCGEGQRESGELSTRRSDLVTGRQGDLYLVGSLSRETRFSGDAEVGGDVVGVSLLGDSWKAAELVTRLFVH